MKEHTLYFILLCLVTIVVYAGYMQATAYGQEKLKFNTQEVREMWYACSTEFQKITPYMPEVIRIHLCDCYSDHMRKKFTPDQVKGLTKEQSRELGESMKLLCPIPVNPPKINT